MKKYIASEAVSLIKQEDCDQFNQHVLEDVEALDENHIAGLGITSEQLDEWESKRLIKKK